eukprot:2718489-Prymnesium_polylepis.1
MRTVIPFFALWCVIRKLSCKLRLDAIYDVLQARSERGTNRAMARNGWSNRASSIGDGTPGNPRETYRWVGRKVPMVVVLK